MNGTIINTINQTLTAQVPGSKFEFSFYETSPLDYSVLWWLFIILLIGVFGLSLLYLKYLSQVKKEHESSLNKELHDFGVDNFSHGFFSWALRRYNIEEPVRILRSEKNFDYIAADEMLRVLQSGASEEEKARYINSFYTVRNKTFLQTE